MRRVVAGLIGTALVLGTLGHGGRCLAASNDAAVAGVVRDIHGTPQMGALVELLRADASTAATAFTDDHGRYLIPAVFPGRYQLRATAAFFVPATRPNLRLAAGAEAVVNLTMSTLFEAANWLPAQTRRPDEPADDWKWTLRSTASRPLLRLTDPSDGAALSTSTAEHHPFVTEGRLSLTNGDGAFAAGGLHQTLVVDRAMEDGDGAVLRADLGDPDALNSAGASADVTAGYERRTPLGGSTRLVSEMEVHPEVVAPGGLQGLGVIRLYSAQQLTLGDAVMVDVGTLMAAERLAATRFVTEPFVRVTFRPGEHTMAVYRYATGRDLQGSEDLDELKPTEDVLTDSAGRPLSDKGLHQEVAVSQKMGSRVMTVSVYMDRMPAGPIEGSGALAVRTVQNVGVVADPSTETFRLASGPYGEDGFSVNLTQNLTPALAALVEFDQGKALRLTAANLALADAANQLQAAAAQALTVALRGRLARTGTTLRAEYRWQPQTTLTQVDPYNANQEEAYLTFYLRQRLAAGRFLPQGMDAVIEATNLLEQGYQPVVGPDGHTLFLAQVPRAIQGGLSFNF